MANRILTTVAMTAGVLCCSAGTQGSRRDSNEPAELITTSSQAESGGYGTDILKIDGRQVKGGSFSLPPGRHSVEVAGTWKNGSGMGAGMAFGIVGALVGSMVDETGAVHSSPLVACFIARPGRTYRIRTFGESGVWKIELFDEQTTYDVKSPCKTAPKPGG